jgi:hypothetical protein
MSRQNPKTTGRVDAWIALLSGVESALERTLTEVSRREQAVADRTGESRSNWLARLAESSQRWSGLWLRSADSEKELAKAENSLLTAEQSLRQHLDALVACRQNLAHWLDRAVG